MELLTTAQAAARMGVPVHMVKAWEALGLVRNHGAGGKGSRAVYDFAEVRSAPSRRVNLRARGVCSQCGAPHWARGLCASCYGRARRAAGLVAPSAPTTPARNAESTLRRGGWVTPPRTLPFRALAVSCPDCGLLRTTPDHLVRREAGRLPACPRCRVRRVTRRARERARTDDEFRRRQRRRTDRNRKRTNDALSDTAGNNGKQWTGPELEVAARADLSAAQVAVMLGRTLYAVKHIRQRLRSDPQTVWLASLGGDAEVRSA